MSARVNSKGQAVLLCDICTRQLIIDYESSYGWFQNHEHDLDLCKRCIDFASNEMGKTIEETLDAILKHRT